MHEDAVAHVQDAPVLPTRLEEVDLLRLLVVNRDLDLYDSQMTILKMKIADAQRTMTTLNQQIREKYGITASDAIDVSTGEIVRKAKPDHVG